MSGTGGVNGAGSTNKTTGTSDESFSTDTAGYKEKTADSAETGANDMQYYLDMQKKMLQEQQAYSALSTVMKARSDSAMTAIRNFK